MSINTSSFEVSTLRIGHLFKNTDVNLAIPPYQRPYVWTSEHIEELLSDWEDHFFDEEGKFKSDAVEYYLGSIMIYDDEEGEDKGFKVIDGQQRLTTLLIMDYVWYKNTSALQNDRFNFEYTSKVSFEKIKANQKYLESEKESMIARKFKEIIQKLVITVIVTNSEDRAFVLFDSQNNRGIPLDEVDYFKSYHLRELNEHEEYLKHFAKKFDSINAINQAQDYNNRHLKSLNELFIKQLWKIRFWSKNQLFFPNRKSVLDTFQKNTLSLGPVDEVKLFPSFNNALGTSLVFNENLTPELKTRIKLYNSNSIDIPFVINQPIQKGIGFFLYTEKYTSIFNHIFRENKIDEINPIIELVYKVFNSYFVNLYQAAIVQYFDKFGKERIEEFAKRLEHYLGAYRMNRASIVSQSPIVLLREYGNVLMDIQQAYLPMEVLNALKRYVPEEFYSGYEYNIEDSENGIKNIFIQRSGKNLTPTRQNYYWQVKMFYSEFITNKNHQLTEKHNWINASINR